MPSTSRSIAQVAGPSTVKNYLHHVKKAHIDLTSEITKKKLGTILVQEHSRNSRKDMES